MYSLSILDIGIICAYFGFAIAVGLVLRASAAKGAKSYFLADRSLPWWWAGISIAATTFAADTPLAVSGIVADKGLSGNWMWYSWIGAHAGVAILFAALWNRAGTVTDAELISLRYSGRSADYLRLFRSFLSGFIINCIVLGWVLKAMVKISAPFVAWDVWFPDTLDFLTLHWPFDSFVGTPGDFMTLVLLVALVAFYSSMSGLKGVVLTDLVQFSLALFGGIWLSIEAINFVGGSEALLEKLTTLYGEHQTYTDLFPSMDKAWVAALNIPAFVFGLYLMIQSFANINSDGGGYMMQRLNATRSPSQARLAAYLFIAIHYIVRVWPWFIVALCALVIFPLGNETVLLPELGKLVASDRELSYPALIAYLLPPGLLGLVIASLLAAFMSTVDTHINWGASYVVNDWFLRAKPEAPPKQQILVARIAVIVFACLALIVSLYISTIEQAWKWVAAIGASLGTPTLLRWVWWRVNASSEWLAAVFGLSTALFLYSSTNLAYEIKLPLIGLASLVGTIAGVFLGPETDLEKINEFQLKIKPPGFWPNRTIIAGATSLMLPVCKILILVTTVIGLLVVGKWILL